MRHEPHGLPCLLRFLQCFLVALHFVFLRLVLPSVKPAAKVEQSVDLVERQVTCNTQCRLRYTITHHSCSKRPKSLSTSSAPPWHRYLTSKRCATAGNALRRSSCSSSRPPGWTQRMDMYRTTRYRCHIHAKGVSPVPYSAPKSIDPPGLGTHMLRNDARAHNNRCGWGRRGVPARVQKGRNTRLSCQHGT